MQTWKDEARYFVSGSNHAGEIRGLALRGSNVGVAAPRVNAATFAALVDLKGLRGVDADGRGYKLRVFVDSGAFSEVEFTAEGPRIAKEITAEAWTEILDLYRRLALELGAQLYVVAPDCVAHQAKTLERLEEHAERLQEIHALGANVIVPVQKGERYTMAEFAEIAVDLLGFLPIFGVPMKKDATTLAELDAFAAFFPATSVPRFHLLGLGLNSPRYAGALETIRARVPAAEVFCDSVRITALVGRTNGRAGGARPLTAARDALISAGVTGVAELKAAAIGTVWEQEYQAELAAAVAAGWVDEELIERPADLSSPSVLTLATDALSLFPVARRFAGDTKGEHNADRYHFRRDDERRHRRERGEPGRGDRRLPASGVEAPDSSLVGAGGSDRDGPAWEAERDGLRPPLLGRHRARVPPEVATA